MRGRATPPRLLTKYDYGSDCGSFLWPKPCNQKAYGGAKEPPAYNLPGVNARLVIILGAPALLPAVHGWAVARAGTAHQHVRPPCDATQ